MSSYVPSAKAADANFLFRVYRRCSRTQNKLTMNHAKVVIS